MTGIIFTDSELTIAIVNVRPRLWRRLLLGDRERSSEAYLERRLWFWSISGLYVGDRISAAIWQAHRAELAGLAWDERARALLRTI